MTLRQECIRHYQNFLEEHQDELSADVRYPIPAMYESQFDAPSYELRWSENFTHFDVEVLQWWDDKSYIEYQSCDLWE